MTPVLQAIVEFLKAQDIRLIFGKIGEGTFPILDRIALDNSLTFISTYRDENAVVMADGYARAGGGPGIVLLTAGSSAALAVPGMTQAFYDGSPVIFLAVDPPSTYGGKEESATEWFRQEAVFEKITRFSCTVSSPHRIIEGLENVYRHAVSGKKGPVYCGIPRDFLMADTPEKVRPHAQFMSPGLSSGEPALIRRACDLLLTCQSPVILLGGGAVWSKAHADAAELAEFLFAPIVTSNGKSGIVPDDYPLSIGRLGSKANQVALQTVKEADVLISFGCTFNDRSTFGFSREIFSPNVRIIQVDIDPYQIGRNYPIELGIVGDARLVLRDMLSILRQTGAEKWPSRIIQRIQRVWELKESWSNEWNRLARSSDVPIRRLRLLKDLVDEVGREALIFGEVDWKHCLKTSFFPMIESYDFPLPGAHLGLAMGAKLALPTRPVVAILGDGAFMSVLTDLATAVEHQIPILVLIARNDCYGQAKAMQTQFCDGRHLGVEHSFPNFTEVASSFGAHAERVESPSHIRLAIQRALEAQKPALIEVIVSDAIRDLRPVFE
ncbi:MAG: thiamine pyrophosphate-binding protein [Candidatus Binatia bacterium]